MSLLNFNRYLIGICLLFSLQTWGQGGATISGGGHGVIQDGKVYLLDYYERGIHDTLSNVDYDIFAGSTCSEMLKMIRSGYTKNSLCPYELLQNSFDEEIVRLLVVKIKYFGLRDAVFSMSVLKAILALRWVYTDEKLRYVDPGVVIDRETVQLALRVGDEVFVQRQHWEKMDLKNRVGLIIHEAIAALADPTLKTQMTVRALTSKLEDLNFYSIPQEEAERFFVFFPSIRRILKKMPNYSSQRVFYADLGVILYPWDERHPIAGEGLVPLAEMALFPVLRVIEKSLDIKDYYINTADELTGYWRNLCLNRKGMQSLEAGFSNISVELISDLQDGSQIPNLKENLIYRSRRKLDCSAGEESFLKSWFSNFQPYDLN